MCLHPEEILPIPDETFRVAKAAFPKGSLYMRLRDELGVFYQDEDFACVYPQVGQPAQAPWRLAMILVMQYLENLSDRQAAQAVQGRIDWKYALSLELTDPGFDFSVLSEFRDRLITGGVERQILDLMLSKFQQLKLLSARGKQRTDSTHILTVVRELTRLEHLGETLRYALNAVAEVAPIWLKSLAPVEWYDRYSRRFEDTRLPRTASEREVLAQTIGADGFYLLDNIYSQASSIELRQLPAIEVLRQVWLQLTNDTWKRLGMASECLGLTRADYLEHIVKHNANPCITREDLEFLASHLGENEPQPSITRQSELDQISDTAIAKQSVRLPPTSELEILRARILSDLKLGKQATGYKTAQKVLNRFITELIGSVEVFGEFANGISRRQDSVSSA
uniref:transposase n=1 Tax=Amazonocrinis nigriterrae TaxID=2840443 RepID=UPI001CEC1E65|nr:transposase [Amazonocrinis nigriterrae]